MPEADLDLRLVRYFLAVAEHRHFGRAAEALRVGQPSLSRQIRRLEQQVGARLLDRTPRGTRLTEAGAEFVPLAHELVRAAEQATARARAAARPSRITVGYALGLVVTPAVRALRRRHPEASVRVRYVDWTEAPRALLDHRVDAFVARRPFPSEGLRVTVLYDEPRVVLLPQDHRLAGKESVTLDDLAGEPMPRLRDVDSAWYACWLAEPHPEGAPDGPVIDSVEDKLEVVAAGEAIAIVVGADIGNLRPDIVAVPLAGVEPGHVALATRADDTNPLVAEFRTYAKELLTGN